MNTPIEEQQNMTAICIMGRRAEARKENLARSHHNLNEIAKAKEKQ